MFIGCEFYVFCGVFFGIIFMITLTVIVLDRYLVIIRLLVIVGVVFKRWVVFVLLGIWFYVLVWSLSFFFGWSKWVGGR